MSIPWCSQDMLAFKTVMILICPRFKKQALLSY